MNPLAITIQPRPTPPLNNPPADHLATLDPLLQRIFSTRNVQSLAELDYALNALLPYHSLMGIDQAVERLYQALSQQESIVILGDFDVDGATSTALAVLVLRAFGAKEVSYLVPNRFEYGYGLSPEILAVAAQRHPNLLVTVDNGIANHAGVDAANAAGIDVIITDHHLAAETLPHAVAIVNPNQPGDLFPSKHLAGVGVIFYTLLALRAYLREKKWFETNQIPIPNLATYLDLVALGTVADVVPLDHNNRILVKQGLARVQAGLARPGINALLRIAKLDPARVEASDLGFSVGPRLNAAGRLEDMSIGIACLLTDNVTQADEYATQLDSLNRERREIEDSMKQQALTALAGLSLSGDLPLGLCLHHRDWHQGVVGILASRIKDRTHRPVIVFATVNDTTLKGSARSVSGVHIRDVLSNINSRSPHLIRQFGGHAMAAGLSIHPLDFEKFSAAFADEISHYLQPSDLNGIVLTDGPLVDSHFCLSTVEKLRAAGPWGQHFPEPLFDNLFTVISQRLVGEKHVKFVLKPNGSDILLDAIAFNIDRNQWPNNETKSIHVAYRLNSNRYREQERLQLMIEQLQAL